jgi:hypothetical protein
LDSIEMLNRPFGFKFFVDNLQSLMQIQRLERCIADNLERGRH